MGNSLRIDPRTLPQLFAWYAADSVAGLGAALPADAAQIGQWNDLSGNARHLVQGTGANQPIFKVGVAGLNGVFPALRFNGTTQSMPVAVATVPARPWTIVGVMKNSLADDNLAHHAISFNNDRVTIDMDWTTNNKLAWVDDATLVNAGPAGDSTLWHIVTLMAEPVGPFSRFTVDGTLFTKAGLAGTNTNSNIQVGQASAAFWSGDIAEVMIFTGDFQPCVLDAIRQALAEKYGLLASQTLAGQ